MIQIYQIDPLNHSKEFAYDELGNLLTVKDAYGNILMSYEYDNYGNRVLQTDRNNHKTVYSFDALNQMTSIKDALLRETHFEFDKLGTLIQAIDPNKGISAVE